MILVHFAITDLAECFWWVMIFNTYPVKELLCPHFTDKETRSERLKMA